jgi:hypothetical protein
MTIPLFARAHDFAAGWLDWLKAMPAWQATTQRFRSIMAWCRSILRSIARQLRLARR